jgi:hypothetical protein
MGKGSKQRPRYVDKDTFVDNWNRVFKRNTRWDHRGYEVDLVGRTWVGVGTIKGLPAKLTAASQADLYDRIDVAWEHAPAAVTAVFMEIKE